MNQKFKIGDRVFVQGSLKGTVIYIRDFTYCQYLIQFDEGGTWNEFLNESKYYTNLRDWRGIEAREFMTLVDKYSLSGRSYSFTWYNKEALEHMEDKCQ